MTSTSARVALTSAVVLAVLAAWTAPAAAQRRDGGGGETAVSRPSSPAPAPAPAPSPAPASAPATSSGDARRGSGDTSTTDGGRSGGNSGRRRPDDGTRVGAAVPREGGRPQGGRNPVIIIPGGYYPWGYGGLGFGGYYGYYDPWYDPFDPYGYGGGGAGYPVFAPRVRDDEGAVRIKVTPREASVYVDGYYTGKVDDFDGVLQKLHLSVGPHRIEVRMQGYEPLAFDVNIEPDQTITYRGELKK